ncbi:beta-lactamase/transpeptidase-like protein [Penicillium brevicompactum]|uniref:Beta-lactamase/transpeptidase-like protein n=1 Tax=Penicillium brevicompactum TaxID=5074 RepID=A0A9W9R2H3_PENBR|nr:beta-lactamase/transpeptidase-like protein [Penicillium brevicompactum]
MHLDSKWSALLPIIRDICSISGIPGVSLGIVENHKTVYTASLGYADIESKTPCDSDTTFVLGSLSKGLTAALVASLHDDGTISSWDAPLKKLLPEFHRDDIYSEITLTDLLTHRTGLASLDSLWLASNNFIYSNFGYEILGQVIEKTSGGLSAEVLRRRLLIPLGLFRTYHTDESRENEARPYAALEDGSLVPIAPPLHGENVLMGPAGGVRSSVNDLLALYKAFMTAAYHEIIHPDTSSSDQPNSIIRALEGTSIPTLPFPQGAFVRIRLGPGTITCRHLPGKRYKLTQSYGWNMCTITTGPVSRGIIPGFNTYNVLLSETGSAVVVLTNSQSLNGGVRWIGELLVEALLNNSHNAPDYTILGKQSAEIALQQVKDINESLAAGRTIETPSRPLEDYVGKYFNEAGNFFIEIGHSRDKASLQVAYMGRKADTFQLLPYREDSFYWTLTHDESAKLAREPIFPMEYHITKFGSEINGTRVSCLWWQHQSGLPEPGELFTKTGREFERAQGEL